MEQHDKMLSPEEQYAQLAPTLDTDGFSLYAAAEEVTGLKVYEEFPYEDNRGMFEMADGHTLLRYLEAAYFGTVTWEIVPGTPYERAILGEVDKTSPEYRAFYQKICAGAAAHIKKRIGKERQNVKGPITEINKESFWDLIHEAKNACGQDMDALQDAYRKRLGQRLLSGIRDENGKREILSTSGGEYVIVDCCNDPQKLKAIQRRIQAQMNGLDVSAGKVRGRVHLLERFMGWVRKERSDGAA